MTDAAEVEWRRGKSAFCAFSLHKTTYRPSCADHSDSMLTYHATKVYRGSVGKSLCITDLSTRWRLMVILFIGIAVPGNSSWMPCAPQEGTGLDDDYDSSVGL